MKELQPRQHLDPDVFDRFAKGPTSDLGPKIREVLECKYGWMHTPFQTLFEAAGRDGLGQLKLHAHETIALRAAWQEVLLTIPERRIKFFDSWPLLIGLPWPPESEMHPDRAQLNRFLDFLRKRAHLEIPGWWEEIVLGAEADGPDSTGFPIPKDESLYHGAGLGIFAPIGTTVVKNGESVVLRLEGNL